MNETKGGLSLKYIYNNLYKGLKKVKSPDYFIKYADNGIDAEREKFITVVAKEAYNFLNNR